MPVVVNGLGAWTKLGVEYLDLAGQLSREAAWTHTEALVYSNRRGFDLVFPKGELGKLPHPPEEWVVAELVAQEVWADDGATYNIGLIYPEWQLSRETVAARREQAVLRQQRQRQHAIGDHSICTERCGVIKEAHDEDDHALCRRSPYAKCSTKGRDVTRDGVSDAPRDDSRDSVRDGSDRTGSVLSSKERRESEKQESHPGQAHGGPPAGVPSRCWVCKRDASSLIEPLTDGLCDRCFKTKNNANERKSA